MLKIRFTDKCNNAGSGLNYGDVAPAPNQVVTRISWADNKEGFIRYSLQGSERVRNG